MLNTSDTNIPLIVTKIFGLNRPFDCDHLAGTKLAAIKLTIARGHNAG